MVPAGLFVIQHRIPLVDALFLSRKEVVGGIENFNLLNFVSACDGVHRIHPIGDMTEDVCLPSRVSRVNTAQTMWIGLSCSIVMTSSFCEGKS